MSMIWAESVIMVKIAFQFSLFNAAEGTSLISILPHPRLFPRSTQMTTFQLLILAQNIFSGQLVNLHLSITNSSTSKKISSGIRNYSKWVLIRLPGVSCACSVVQEQKRKCAKGKKKIAGWFLAALRDHIILSCSCYVHWAMFDLIWQW